MKEGKYRYRYRRGVFDRFDMPTEKIVLVLVPVVLALFAVSQFILGESQTSVIPTTTTTTTVPESGFEVPEIVPTAEAPKTKQSATIKVPAVDDEGNGVVTLLRVDVMPGEGRALVNINQLLFWVDTQYSIQSAKIVAQNVTGMNVSGLDIVYTIETNATIIEGPSAGAALTVATVAALENRTLDDTVMITGTITRTGLIGPIGGVVEKAKAAKDIGAELFLMPGGQSKETYYEPQRNCQRMGPITYCTTTYTEKSYKVSDEAGIEVEEVNSIDEALKYFLE